MVYINNQLEDTFFVFILLHMMAISAILCILEIITLWQSPLFAKQVKRAFRYISFNTKLLLKPTEKTE